MPVNFYAHKGKKESLHEHTDEQSLAGTVWACSCHVVVIVVETSASPHMCLEFVKLMWCRCGSYKVFSEDEQQLCCKINVVLCGEVLGALKCCGRLWPLMSNIRRGDDVQILNKDWINAYLNKRERPVYYQKKVWCYYQKKSHKNIARLQQTLQELLAVRSSFLLLSFKGIIKTSYNLLYLKDCLIEVALMPNLILASIK